MNRALVEKFMTHLPGTRILVVGDLMLDEYVWGRTDRISPEAPVQVVEVQREDLRLGGAGNVINNLVVLGCRVCVASVVGDDADGQVLRRMLSEKKIDDSGIVAVPGRTTSRKTRILASNQQMLRIDRESRVPVDGEQGRMLVDFVRDRIDQFQVILLSDYLKGVLSDEVLRGIIEIGREKGVPVLVDPKGNDYRKYRGATLLTPNRKEAQVASGIEIRNEADLVEAGRTLRQSLDLDALVLTRSEEGMSLFVRDRGEIHLPTEAKEVFDVTGAGDTVLSVLGAGLACGFSLEEAARLSNVAAGIVVGKVGTSTVSAEEILETVGRSHRDSDLKIKTRDVLSVALEHEREKRRRIVFTNGCFDLLHAGHVQYLQNARRLGDLLVLGLNSDQSVQRLKGPKRPLIGENERAHILAALDCIDYVCLFDEDTPLELIRAVKPDILVKGGDYSPEGVVGKEIVESYGGRVEIIEFVAGKSTTSIIDKVLRAYQEE